MKTIILIFSMLISLSGCSDDNTNKQETSIIGTWQLIEGYGSDGANGRWVTVKNGYTYTFRNDGKIMSNRFPCNGSYIFNSSSNITINFDCKNLKFNLTYDLEYDNEDNLILTPNPINCDEGCMEKFQRIQD